MSWNECGIFWCSFFFIIFWISSIKDVSCGGSLEDMTFGAV